MASLVDTGGTEIIGPARNQDDLNLVVAGATSIMYDATTGLRRGVYIDDMTPNRDSVAALMVQWKIPLVVVAITPAEPNHKIAGCIMALEWYPWAYGYSVYPLPYGPEGFILQRYYGNPPGRLPTTAEYNDLKTHALSHYPTLIWRY